MISDLKNLSKQFLDSESKGAKAGKFILALLLVAGAGAIAVTAPGIISLAAKYSYSNKLKKRQIINSFDNLRRGEFIEIIHENNGRATVKLTNKGLIRIKKFSVDEIKIKKPARWDKKWRIVMFDIPVRPRAHDMARRALRETMIDLGFIKLQKSAWILPYECEDEILFISETYNVTKFIEVLTVDRLLHEDVFLQKFKLRK